jgi:hypothetical protein
MPRPLTARRWADMEDRDRPQELQEQQSPARSYEAPEANVIPVKLEDRVLGCNFSTISVCELTE